MAKTWEQQMADADIPVTARDVLDDDELAEYVRKGGNPDKIVNGVTDERHPDGP